MFLRQKMVLIALCISIGFFSEAQEPHPVQDAYFNKKLGLIAVETDMALRKRMANDLMTEISSIQDQSGMKDIVDRARLEQVRFFLIDGDYPSFRQNFDKLPKGYRDFLIQSGYSYLLKDPEASSFAISYLEGIKAEKEIALNSVNMLESTSRKKDMIKDDYNYVLLSLTNAYVLKGEVVKARQYIPVLISFFGRQQISVNETICAFTEKDAGADSAIHLLEQCIALNKFNAAMEAQLKRLYTVKNGSENGFTAYLSAIKLTYRSSMQKELQNMIRNEKAPEFALKNLSGETVTLSSLKGKVVVIDFWATWCAPCKASFPAMQQLVNEYSNNKDQVVFLFISSGERGADIKALVQKYVASTPYTFNVLLDSPADLAAKAFRVSAFPTKLLIDQKGFIRFKPASNENHDDMKMEMKIMIDFLLGQIK